ncbi:MAG: hypothetical protein MJZ97_08760, partial [Bacteroidales bacterium]|nr:hypothetical protein [Bacteroidales bacterium]
MTFANGIQANKFYGMKDAIAVTLEAASAPKFSVGVNTTVEFAPGNLWYGKADGETTAAFHFEANQWETTPTTDGTWDASHVSHFFWSNTTDWQTSGKEPYASSYSYSTQTTSDVFFTEAEGFKVGNEAGWRTLSIYEWSYLLGTDFPKRTNATSLCAWKELDDGTHKGLVHKGLVILPDGTENPSTVMDGITSTTDLASSGAVFLPAAGHRDGTEVCFAGLKVGYWSGTPYEYENYEGACYMYSYSYSDLVDTSDDRRDFGYPVRLVR